MQGAGAKLIIIVLCVVVVGVGLWFFSRNSEQVPTRGHIQWQNPLSTTSSQFAEKPGLIRVTSPAINALVQSPLRVKGEARWSWFVNGNLGVKLFGENGNLLAWLPGQATVPTGKELQPDTYVPFEVGFEFNAKGKNGILVIEEPDALKGWTSPNHRDELRIPVRF